MDAVENLPVSNRPTPDIGPLEVSAGSSNGTVKGLRGRKRTGNASIQDAWLMAHTISAERQSRTPFGSHSRRCAAQGAAFSGWSAQRSHLSPCPTRAGARHARAQRPSASRRARALPSQFTSGPARIQRCMTFATYAGVSPFRGMPRARAIALGPAL